MDKQIRGIEGQEIKVQKTLKDAAKKNDKVVCRMLAKEILRSRKAKNRMYTNKAHMSSMGMHLTQQAGTLPT
jgi:charged multivesicular body protein 3